MIGHPRKIHVRESNPSKRRPSKNVSGCGSPIFAEVESGSGAGIGVSPAVQYDSRDVSGSIEAGSYEHIRKLLTNLPLILTERCCDHLRAPHVALIFRGMPRA